MLEGAAGVGKVKGCWKRTMIDERVLGPKLRVGTVWGFGDLSGEIHTHWSVSFLSDWEDMGDRLVGIWVKGSSNRYLCTDMGSLKVSPNYQNSWGKCGVELYFNRLETVIFAKTAACHFA